MVRGGSATLTTPSLGHHRIASRSPVAVWCSTVSEAGKKSWWLPGLCGSGSETTAPPLPPVPTMRPSVSSHDVSAA